MKVDLWFVAVEFTRWDLIPPDNYGRRRSHWTGTDFTRKMRHRDYAAWRIWRLVFMMYGKAAYHKVNLKEPLGPPRILSLPDMVDTLLPFYWYLFVILGVCVYYERYFK